jgi:hypothetical protein
MSYLFENEAKTKNGKDFFVAGPSGIGYMYPDYYPQSSMPAYDQLTATYMKNSDLRILNVIGNDPSDEVSNIRLQD